MRDGDHLILAVWLAAAAACLSAACFTAPARAHDWYPSSCCSGMDCKAMGEAGWEPEPTATPQGWLLADGTLIAYADARPSPDGRFHSCRRAGDIGQPLIFAAPKPCLFVPGGVS